MPQLRPGTAKFKKICIYIYIYIKLLNWIMSRQTNQQNRMHVGATGHLEKYEIGFFTIRIISIIDRKLYTFKRP